VKSEPREVTLPGLSRTAESTGPVKGEPTDDARVVSHIVCLPLSGHTSKGLIQFLDRGLPIPSYVQSDIASPLSKTGSASGLFPKSEEGEPLQPRVRNHQEQPANVKQTYFTVYNSSDEIAHTPEASFKEGLGMVKAIKEYLKKLELGSKLRREVWDREIAK
jgi:hypothetical protein